MAKVNFMTKEEEEASRKGWDQAGIDKKIQDQMIAQMRGGEDTELKKQAGFIGAEDLYSSDGDDYTIDDSAFAGAQLGTGDNETVASVAGGSNGGSGSSETNSNVNTGVFGGSAHAAKPGQSLWK